MTTPNDTKRALSPADMARLSEILFRASHNPETRAATARIVQKVAPEAAKAYSDVFLQDQLNAFREELKNEKMQERVKAAAEKQKAQRAELKKNYTEEQIVEIEKNVMVPLGLGNYIAASKIYAADNPPLRPELTPPEDIASGGATWEFPTVPGKDGKMLSFEDFAKNPIKASREAALQVITDFKRQRLNPAFSHAR